MVGVPGRSKGCVTCRKRKKGCDLKRPACGQCLERNIKCGGYDTDRVFVTSKYEAPPKFNVRKVERRDSPSDLLRVTASTYQLLPRSLAQSAFNAKGMEAAFELFPVQADGGGGLRFSTQFSTLLPDLSTRDEALQRMVCAVGLAALGKGSNNHVVLRKGRIMYGKALQELGTSLQNPGRQTIEALLATTRLMGLYEILYGPASEDLPQARNWMSHAQGEIALIVSRGPEAFTSDAAHLMFTLARYNAAIIGIRSRRPVVFNEEPWKTIPWRGRPKPARDTIIDIMLEIPEILAALDYVDYLSPDDVSFDELRLEAVNKCWAAHWKLTAWIEENFHEVYTPETEEPVIIEFPSLSAATLSVLYWGSATLLYQSLDRSLRYSAIATLPPYIDHPHGRPFARLIVRSVSWLFRKEHGVAGPSAVLFPLGIALMFFRQCDTPDTEYMNLVFAVWDNPDYPRSVKDFLRSMSKAINLPTRSIPENPVTWSTSEIMPMYDIDGNVLSGPFLRPSRFLSAVGTDIIHSEGYT